MAKERRKVLRNKVKVAEIMILSESLRAKNLTVQNKIKQSVMMYGQLNPIHVTDKYEVIKGRTVLRALKELQIEDVLCVVHFDVDQSHFESLQLTLTCLHQEVNDIRLADMIKKAVDHTNKQDVLRKVPFTDKELDQLLLLTEMDWSSFLKEENEVNQQQSLF